MKKTISIFLVIMGLLLMTGSVKFYFLLNKILYEPIQTNVWFIKSHCGSRMANARLSSGNC